MELLVDGYNVMHALPLDQEWPGQAFKDRRAGFLRRLAYYAGGRPHRITVVFDGAKGGTAEGGADSIEGIRVYFSPRGVDADALMRRALEDAPRPKEVLLVSSDKALAGYARSLGASTARADELVRKLLPRREKGGNSGRSGTGRRQNLALW